MTRQRSEKQLANDQRLRDLAAARRVDNSGQPPVEPVTVEAEGKTVEISQDKLDYILKELAELKADKATPAPQTAQVTSQGVVGSTEKYSTNKSLYEDPRERLMDEADLQRFAIKDNYELTWDIFVSRYQTAQGLWFTEPRFEMELRKLDLDEDGTVKRKFLVQKYVKHEDFDAAIDIARALGMEIDDSMGRAFIDEMRYQDIKMWLRELFYPPKAIAQSNNGRSETVIGGTVVTVYENPVDLNREISGV